VTADEIATLERIADRAWPAEVRSSLGDWILNASSGYSGRLNACWPLGSLPSPLEPALDDVEAWYAARGLPPVFKPAGETPELTAALAARGYRPRTPTLMMIAPVGPMEAAASVDVREDADAAFESVFLGVQADPGDAAERMSAFRRVRAPKLFARIDVDAKPAAIGATAVEGEWAGVFGMRTLPDMRRRGLAREIVQALLAGAWSSGARKAYLQVEAPNAPAIALYQAFGFETAFAYHYWDRAAT